jgi:hypothetical protein
MSNGPDPLLSGPTSHGAAAPRVGGTTSSPHHMTTLLTLKLGASSIGAASRAHRATAPVETEPAVERPAPQSTPNPGPAQRRTRRERPGLKRFLGLGALSAVATATAVIASGAVHDAVVRDLVAGLAVAAAASILALVAIAFKHPRAGATSAAAAPTGSKRFSTSKAILVLMMLMGIIAYFGGAGTFAGFTAETTNPNDALASGTLTLQNNVTSNCASQAGESNNNVNANCNVALSFSNQEPGTFVGTATVTLTNTGSLNASKLYLWAPYANAVLSTATGTGSISSLAVYASGHGPAGVEGTMAAGDLITVTYGSTSQTFCVGAGGAAGGATTIPVSSTGSCTGYSTTPTISFLPGATVQDTSSDTSATNTNCYDTQQTVLGSGSGWNPATGNPLCNASLLYVQETTGGKNYCWFGNNTGAPTGACTAPISVNPTGLGTSANQTIAAGTYAVSALKGNIKSGDTLAFKENGNTVTCPASADYYLGATSVQVGACAVQAGSVNGIFDNNAVITDTTTLTTLSTDVTHTISQFDRTKNYSLKQELTPVTANGVTGAAATDLASAGVRTFVVGVAIPGPTTPQNQLQGLKSTFGLTWHIDQ